MKRIISLALTLILAVSCLGVGVLNVSAASSVIAFSSKTIDVGENVTVTITVSAETEMWGLEFVLQYDPEILEFVEGDDCSGTAGVIRVASAPGKAKASLSYKFKALKAGSCYISTADSVYVDINDSIIDVPNQGANLTVKDETLSDNANLKSLSLSEGKLSPAFSASKTSYTATVDREVTDCKIYATAQDSNAKVAVEGGSNLKVGKNTCTVTVTAPSGAQKTYTVVITRTEEAASSQEDTSSEETSSQMNPLDTEIDGTAYTVAQNIDSLQVPLGFTASKTDYNGNEVAVITDEDNEYIIYYLTAAGGTELVPYTLNTETNAFEKLQYIYQGGRYYIITDFPEDDFDGYYTTNSEISGFNVKCYASNTPELSVFSYIYCFNGEDYGYYRYDSSEKVVQRYPEMTMALSTSVQPIENEGLSKRFASLDTNAKIIVIGILLVILGVLALAILVIARIIYHRRSAEYATNLNYADEFDSVDYDNKFSVESDGFVAESDDEVLDDLDFSADEETAVSDYLVEDEPTAEEIEPEEDLESDYLTEDDTETEE